MILLDTHVLLWVVTGRRSVGKKAIAAIGRADAVLASAISHVEISVKSRRGKLSVPSDFPRLVNEQGIAPLPFTQDHAGGLALIPRLVGHDPFDRMLLAQAQVDGHQFMTADGRLLDLDLPWVLDATA